MGLTPGLAKWVERGTVCRIAGRSVFVVDVGQGNRTVLILHGFPGSSYDWVGVLPHMEVCSRVIVFDMIGFGLSEKPFDHRPTIFEQADLAEAVMAHAGVTSVRLVSHDMGQTVASELMIRQSEAKLSMTIESSLVTNGSTLIDMAELTPGHELLLSLPDRPLAEPLDLDAMRPALEATFAGGWQPPRTVIDDMIASIHHNGGDYLLHRLIRYVEERRQHLGRWTEGFATFVNPLHVVWGRNDPIAKVAMAHRIAELRPQTALTIWDDVSHWPPIEAPERLAAVINAMP